MGKNIIIIMVIVCVALAVWLFSRENEQSIVETSPSPTPTLTPTASPIIQESFGAVVTLAGGLKIQDIVVGTGDEATNSKLLSVHYVGTLENGKKFDSSIDRGQPFSFVIGSGQVIQGWEKGVLGMKVGGKRKLIIPASLGYGARGAGNMIPPNATLIFEVQLLAVNSAQD